MVTVLRADVAVFCLDLSVLTHALLPVSQCTIHRMLGNSEKFVLQTQVYLSAVQLGTQQVVCEILEVLGLHASGPVCVQ